MLTTSHPLRDSYDDRTLGEKSVRANAVIDDKARKSAYDPSNYCRASSACGCRYINTIRAWLGHVSLNTTNIYVEVDLEMKAKALATCEVPSTKPAKRWREEAGLMAFPADALGSGCSRMNGEQRSVSCPIPFPCLMFLCRTLFLRHIKKAYQKRI